jgi:hypothetical protein
VVVGSLQDVVDVARTSCFVVRFLFHYLADISGLQIVKAVAFDVATRIAPAQ